MKISILENNRAICYIYILQPNHMSRTSLTLIVLCLTVTSFGQQTKTQKDFEADFTRAIDKRFTAEQLNKMFSNYSELLTPHSDVTRLAAGLEGHAVLQ